MNAFVLISRLIGFAVLLQSLEFIKIRESFSDKGIWRWSELRADYLFLPKKVLAILDYLMKPTTFTEMMTVRFFAALLAVVYPYSFFIFLFLFLTTFLITLRWRGSFNGGSDYLTLIILLSICIGFLHPLLTKAALWYITLQVISSYFLAGLYKIKQKKWRHGTAIYSFVSSPTYQVPKQIISLSQDPRWAMVLSWGVILFELSFPAVLFHPGLTVFFLGAGVLFHLGNFLVFGLNRFFWVWCASYPAIYFCSKLF